MVLHIWHRLHIHKYIQVIYLCNGCLDLDRIAFHILDIFQKNNQYTQAQINDSYHHLQGATHLHRLYILFMIFLPGNLFQLQQNLLYKVSKCFHLKLSNSSTDKILWGLIKTLLKYHI